MISVKALLVLSRDKILGKQPENMRAVDVSGAKLAHPGDQRAEPRIRRRRTVPERAERLPLERVKEVAACGVTAISFGCLTHSAGSVDLSLEWKAI